MSKLVILFDNAMAASAKKQARLKRTIRKHTVAAMVEQSHGKLNLTEVQVEQMLNGKLNVDPQSAILLAGVLGLTAREILDAQTDDQLSSAGDLTSRAATVKEVPLEAASTTAAKKPRVAKPATRTSPSKPMARRSEVIETL